MKASEIRELLKLLDRPGMISLAGGIPDPSLFDMESFRVIFAEELRNPGSLQYSSSEGHLPLREWIAAHMVQRGVKCTPDNILLTHGSQQALDLIGKLFLDPGDGVMTTVPTYLGALQSFSAFEPEFQALDLSRSHLAVEGSEGSRRTKLIYLVPDFANPTSEVMDQGDRLATLSLADRLGAIVVEDAAYTSLRYEGEDLPSIAALDHARSPSIEGTRTLYCGTFSKTLSPGLRVGWVCGPSSLVRRLTLIKQAADLHTATLNQRVIHRVAMESFDKLVAKARAAYMPRRDAMLAALEANAPPGTDWTRPQGGLFVWITLPEEVDASELLKQAIALNVAFVPGAAFRPDGRGSNTLRLSYSLWNDDTGGRAVATVCDLIRLAASKGRRGRDAA